MKNRLPRPTVNVPKRYRQKDFMDVIDDLCKRSIRIENATLSFSMTTNEVQFNRFGKLFKASICVFMGEAEVVVEEV